MVFRAWSWMVFAFAALLLGSCGGPTPPPAGDAEITVTIAPAFVTLEPGAQQTFTATVSGTSDDRVTWSATGGSISGSGSTVTYSAPDVVGEYAVLVTSVRDPTSSASASVAVTTEPEAGTSRIEIVSDASILLTGAGDASAIVARVIDADGQLIEGASLTFTSNDPDDVEVDRDGIVTARTDAAYTTITVASGSLAPRFVTVAVARPLTETRLVPDAAVLTIDADGGRASLARTADTEALATGDILVSNAGLLSRVISVATEADSVEVTLAAVTLEEAFERVVIRGVSEPVTFDTTITGDTIAVSSDDRRIGRLALSISSLRCVNEVGAAVGVSLQGMSLSIASSPTAAFDYDSDIGILEISIADAPTLSASVGTIEVGIGGEFGFSCSLDLPKIDVYLASFWGLVSVTGSLTPTIGFEGRVGYDGPSIGFTGPSAEAKADLLAGLRYDTAIHEWSSFGSAERSWSTSWGSFSQAPTSTVQLYLGPFSKTKLGLTLKVLLFDAVGVDALEPKLGVGVKVDVPLGDRYADTYAGPTLGLEASLGVDVGLELTGGVARALAYFNVRAGVTFASFDVFGIELDITPRPAVSSNLTTVTQDVSLRATVPTNLMTVLATGTVEFVARRAGESTGTVVATAPLDANLQAAAVWSPTRAFNGEVRVDALWYDAVFGSIQRPLRSVEALVMTVDASVDTPTPPSITAFSVNPGSGSAPLEATFGWSLANPSGSPLTCTLTPGDGRPSYALDTCTSTTTVNHRYEDAGSFTAALSVTDGTTTVTATTPVLVQGTGPVAPGIFTATPNPVLLNQNTTFNWTASDPNNDTLTCTIRPRYPLTTGQQTYTGTFCTSGQYTHAYTATGTYEPRITFTDNQGGTTYATTRITVEPPATETDPDAPSIDSFTATPVAFTPSSSGGISQERIGFAWTAQDPGGESLTCTLQPLFPSSGDTVTRTGANCTNGSATITYNLSGPLIAKLTVTNGKGTSTTSYLPLTVNVTPTPPPSNLTATPIPFTPAWSGGTDQERVNVTWLVDDGTGDTLLCTVQPLFPSSTNAVNRVGAACTNGSVTFTYNRSGPLIAKLTVTNGKGTSTTSYLPLTVNVSANPRIDSLTIAPQPIVAGSTTTVSWASSDPATHDLACYVRPRFPTTTGATTRSGASCNEGTLNHTYTTSGTYTVRMEVTNGRGGNAVRDLTVTVP